MNLTLAHHRRGLQLVCEALESHMDPRLYYRLDRIGDIQRALKHAFESLHGLDCSLDLHQAFMDTADSLSVSDRLDATQDQ